MTSRHRRVGWWLALESAGSDAVAWSLIRVDDDAPTGPVGAGLWTDLGEVRSLAALVVAGGETSGQLWTGPLVHPSSEPWTAVRLGQALLPAELRDELLGTAAVHTRHTVTIATRGWLAQVPWEALALDEVGDVRLVERCRVLAGLSPAVNAGRRRAPHPRAGARILRVLDPGSRSDPELQPIYPGGYPLDWDDRLGPGERLHPDGRSLSPDRFGELLRAEPGWSRLFYFGHCLPGSGDTPAGAALVLSTAAGSEPFTAHAWLSAPDFWPCPARVALIACGSDDTVHLEQSGLPIAAVNAGAELLTVTRWTLPLDEEPPRQPATTRLALAVDAAHDDPDPAAAIGRWQRERLAAWRSHGDRGDSPLLWASLASYQVPHVEPSVIDI
jgi:hypothetical protein